MQFMQQAWHTVLPIAQTMIDENRTGLMGYHLLAAIVFASVGVLVLALSLFLMEKLTPYSITNEIIEEHNTALSIVVGAIILGISMIIAASIIG